MQIILIQTEGTPFRCALRLLLVKTGKAHNYYTYYTTFDCKFRLFPRIDGSGELWYFGIVVRWYDQITIFLRANLRNFES